MLVQTIVIIVIVVLVMSVLVLAYINKKLCQEKLSLNHEISILKTNNDNLQKNNESLQNIKDYFIVQFQEISNKILKEKSSEFTEQNRANIDSILNPLKNDLNNFQNLLKDSDNKHTEYAGYLKKEFENLHQNNNRLSDQANNLTRALTYKNKTQGDWGEAILYTILEQSGLVKGTHYRIQEPIYSTETDQKFIPDVIVNLPDNKSIIIDSKVSLKDYTSYVNTTNKEEEKKCLDEHISSVEKHMKNLSSKEYPKTLQDTSTPGQTLDFVLMFMPIEPAYFCVVDKKRSLVDDYFNKNIIIVTPSSLITMLKIINKIWAQKNQDKNTQEIVQLGTSIYEKLAAFTDNMVQIQLGISSTQKAYTDAVVKLNGKGGITSLGDKLQRLANSKKPLNTKLINYQSDDDNI